EQGVCRARPGLRGLFHADLHVLDAFGIARQTRTARAVLKSRAHTLDLADPDLSFAGEAPEQRGHGGLGKSEASAQLRRAGRTAILELGQDLVVDFAPPVGHGVTVALGHRFHRVSPLAKNRARPNARVTTASPAMSRLAAVGARRRA